MPRPVVSRRAFLQGSAASALATPLLSGAAAGPDERLNVACIGIGGKGAGDVLGVAGAGGNIVALCDVDDKRRAQGGRDIAARFPAAKFYRDFRVMLEKEDRNIDAVTVSTPDHVHCHAAVMAMRMGKHVFCQKPLSHSVWEARLMAETARQERVATQMGNQAHAGEPIRRAVELVRAGLLGKVSEVHCWTNRPIWPQGMKQPLPAAPVPAGLDWDLWVGPAPYREYGIAPLPADFRPTRSVRELRYMPFSWRGWWDFGCGALGDMACHIMDMPFWALELKSPTRVEADSVDNTAQSAPTESTVTYYFAEGPHSAADLKFAWYDGGRMPPSDVLAGVGKTPEELARGFESVLIGEKGKLFFSRRNLNWLTSPDGLVEDAKDTPHSLPRVESEKAEWLAACRGGAPALSGFEHSGPFSEVVLLGNVAIRLGQTIDWDGPNMKSPNCPEADRFLRRAYRKGWEI